MSLTRQGAMLLLLGACCAAALQQPHPIGQHASSRRAVLAGALAAVPLAATAISEQEELAKDEAELSKDEATLRGEVRTSNRAGSPQ